MIKTLKAGAIVAVLLLALTVSLPAQSEEHVSIADVDAEGEIVSIEVKTMTWMANWVLISLGDGGPEDIDQLYRFPSLCTVKAGTTITIHSGDTAADRANQDDICAAEREVDLYWDVSGNGPNVWNNSGDTACLLNRHLELVAEFKTRGGTSDCRDDYAL